MNDLLDIRDAIEAAKEKYFKDNPTTKIQDNFLKEIKKSEQEILRKVLGFDQNVWGNRTWKLDHCNGRAGNSPIGDRLSHIAEKAVKEWEQTELQLVLTQGMKKSMQKRVNDLIERKINSSLNSYIEKEIDLMIQDSVNGKMKQFDEVIKEMMK